MKFITALAFADPAQYLRLARASEAAGFDAVALSDHLVHPKTIETPYPYTSDGKPRWEPFTDWPDPWVAAGYMASVTARLRFLTSIFVLPMRNPVHVAKAVGTVAVLSGGRAMLGVGVGWMREEFEISGQAFERRGARANEMIEVLHKLWGGGYVEHHGEFYDFAPVEMSPVPPGPVPILAGGLSKPALRRAAQHCDGWVSDLHTTEELRGYIGQLTELRADSERAGRPFEVVVSCMDAVDLDGYRRLEDLGVTHVNTQPWVFYGGVTTDVGRRCDGIRRFGDEIVSRLA